MLRNEARVRPEYLPLFRTARREACQKHKKRLSSMQEQVGDRHDDIALLIQCATHALVPNRFLSSII